MSDPANVIANFNRVNSSKITAFPSKKLETGLDKYMNISAVFRQKGLRTDPYTSTLLQTIVLPIPANLQDGYSWAYQDAALGRFLGPIVPQLATHIRGAYEAAKGTSFNFESIWSDAKDAWSGTKDIFNGMVANSGGYAQSAYSNIVAKSISAITNGAVANGDAIFIGAANPYLTNAFAGVGFKVWNFQFYMVARNPEDSAAILSIINFFRYYGSPRGLNTPILDTDYVFKINFGVDQSPIPKIPNLPNGINQVSAGTVQSAGSGAPAGQVGLSVVGGNANQFLPVVGECVITDLQVNYNVNGLSAFHGDGSPVDVLINVAFKETSIVTQETILRNEQLGVGLLDTTPAG